MGCVCKPENDLFCKFPNSVLRSFLRQKSQKAKETTETEKDEENKKDKRVGMKAI